MLTIDHKYLVVLRWRTICLQKCSRKTVKLIQKLSPREELRVSVQRLASSLEKQAGVKNSLLLEQSWLSHIAILHSWCHLLSLSYNPCHFFFFFFFEVWICKSLGFQQFENRQLKKIRSSQDLSHVFCFNSRCLDVRCKAVFPCLKIFALWRLTKISNLLSFRLIKQCLPITRTRSQIYQLKNLYLPPFKFESWNSL